MRIYLQAIIHNQIQTRIRNESTRASQM